MRKFITTALVATLFSGGAAAGLFGSAAQAQEASDEAPASQPAVTERSDPAIGVGDTAPGFLLKDQDLNPVTLAEFRGKKVVLAFYVYAFTGG